MYKTTQRSERTRELLIKHYQTYPKLQTQDVFKYIFQSAFGCEHLVSSERVALDRIKREYEELSKTALPLTEPLDGEYSRVSLSWLNGTLKPETLAKIFCLSAKNEPDGKTMLEQKLQAAKELVEDGKLLFEPSDFAKILDEWRAEGYQAIRHSSAFRSEYHPAYRVVGNRYADFLRLFAEIDRLSSRGSVIVAIEGGSASGKTTLADSLCQVYDCNVFHMDDFFLRPEQRTPERFAEIGGNVDRERILEEVLLPRSLGKPVCYRPFDCATQTLRPPVTVTPNRLTVVEGAYSMHPALAPYYTLSVFLNVDSAYQQARILKRNSPAFAKRFFEEWIPLEQRYFSQTQIRERCDLTLPIEEASFS
jgi:uridine kinase